MGVRQATALYPDPQGQDQRSAGRHQGLAQAVDKIASEDEVFFSERFVLPRPLMKAITSDEAGRAADRRNRQGRRRIRSLPARIAFRLSGYGAGNRHVKAKQIPLVILTSNNAREMSDALKRRCLHLYIDFPNKEQELAIIRIKVPEAAEKLAEEVVSVVQSLRKLDLKKTPGISETLDWVKALTLLNVQSLDNALVDETLDTIVKYEGDVRKAQEELKEYMRRVRTRRGGTEPTPAGRAAAATRTCSTSDQPRSRTAAAGGITGGISDGRKAGRICQPSAPERRAGFAGGNARRGRGQSDVTGLGERDLFRAALRATMIKRASELPVFEELFDVYFSGLGEIIKGASKAVQDALSMSDKDFQDFLDDMEEMLKKHGQELSELAKQLLQNNDGQLERMMREAARAVRMQGIQRTIEENYFARALARALGFDKIEAGNQGAARAAPKLDMGSALRAKMEEYLDRRLKMLDDIIRKYVRQEREKRDMKAREEQRMNQLGDKSFYYLSDEELEKMREAVTRLAQRLKNIIAVRRKRMKKGRFDIKRTLRANLANGGVPFKLKFEKRKREKPQILIMCDVSDSVRNASRFMLQFVYSLQDLYSRVRSFVFVADVGEVTESFPHQRCQGSSRRSAQG